MLLDKVAKIEKEKELIDKWGWITEGIEDYESKLNTSLVLENSFEEMVTNGQATPDFLEKLDEDVYQKVSQQIAAICKEIPLYGK